MRNPLIIVRADIIRQLFTAALVLAMVITFSCSSNDDDPVGGNVSLPSGNNDGYYRYYDSDDENQRCQNGVVQGKCGDSWYNKETHFCSSDNTILEICGNNTVGNLLVNGIYFSTLYAAQSPRCKNGSFELKCGNNWYNSSTHTCKDDNIITLKENYESMGYRSCGNSWYDPASADQRCQNGVIQGKCGNVWYDSYGYFCNNGVVEIDLLKVLIVSEECGSGNYFAYNHYNPDSRCKDGVVEWKCGDVWYNTNTHTCKDDVVKARTRCGNGTSLPSVGGNQSSSSSRISSSSRTSSSSGGSSSAISSSSVESSSSSSLATYTITYNANDGTSAPVAQTKTHDVSLILSTAVPSRTGYIFVNWNTASNGSGTSYASGASYTVNTSVMLYAQWSRPIVSNCNSITFRTVTIGTQTWMAENLNCNINGSKCYNNNEDYCDTYGRLYDWATAMDLPSSCNSSSCASIGTKHRGVCPSGWHIPSYAEWETLTIAVGGSSTAGTKLKATNGWNWNDYDGVSGNGTDDYDFSALPGGGYLYSYGSFYSVGVGSEGIWWSASEHGLSNVAYDWYMNHDIESAGWRQNSKDYLFSVRCLKD